MSDNIEQQQQGNSQVWCRICATDCPTCVKPCSSSKWCNTCKTWTSGNHEIDTIVVESICNNTSDRVPIQWIDPSGITDVRHLADGGFGTIDVATWLDDNNYETDVVLK